MAAEERPTLTTAESKQNHESKPKGRSQSCEQIAGWTEDGGAGHFCDTEEAYTAWNILKAIENLLMRQIQFWIEWKSTDEAGSHA